VGAPGLKSETWGTHFLVDGELSAGRAICNVGRKIRRLGGAIESQRSFRTMAMSKSRSTACWLVWLDERNAKYSYCPGPMLVADTPKTQSSEPAYYRVSSRSSPRLQRFPSPSSKLCFPKVPIPVRLLIPILLDSPTGN
jgi:hypothetical protein